MSSPYALPEGPTRFAESSTSMPPPEPRSSTVSPGFSLARAVGFPQPSEARRAASGTLAPSSSLYSFDVIGSQLASRTEPPPQQDPLPDWTRVAAWPYFSFTTCLMSALVLIRLVSLHSCAEARTRGADTLQASLSFRLDRRYLL